MADLTRDQITAHFRMLDFLLSISPLPAAEGEDGETRRASAEEFMLMQVTPDDQCIGFKHVVTRNYVYLRRKGGGWTLDVPRTTSPWHRGEF